MPSLSDRIAAGDTSQEVVEAKFALANWAKYAEAHPSDELVYQGNKLAAAITALLRALGE